MHVIAGYLATTCLPPGVGYTARGRHVSTLCPRQRGRGNSEDGAASVGESPPPSSRVAAALLFTASRNKLEAKTAPYVQVSGSRAPCSDYGWSSDTSLEPRASADNPSMRAHRMIRVRSRFPNISRLSPWSISRQTSGVRVRQVRTWRTTARAPDRGTTWDGASNAPEETSQYFRSQRDNA